MQRLNLQQEFTRHPFFVSHYADKIKDAIYTYLLGIERRPNFWTVGAASYKDKPSRTEKEFEDFANKKNAQMMYQFKGFYEFQLAWFEYTFKQKFCYMPNMPLPGFHVFKYCEEFEKPLARAHVDVPFDNFAWGKQVGYDKIFTHVVAVEVPIDAGMWAWDITADDIDRYGIKSVTKQIAETEPLGTVFHKKDTMVIHSGRFAHQIKPFVNGNGDWRITLQSHAVLIDGVWNLYW